MADAVNSTPVPSSTRRALLRGLASLPIVGAVSAPTLALAAQTDADAEISALYDEFRQAAAAWEAASDRENAAEKAYLDIAPEFPQMAIKTEADREMFLCVNVGEQYSERDLPRLRKPQVDRKNKRWPAKNARAQEVVTALEEYIAADSAALLMSGYDEAEALAGEAYEARKAIETRILETPANTIAGVVMKARVVEWCYAGKLPDPGKSDPSRCTADRFAMAVAADLVRLSA